MKAPIITVKELTKQFSVYHKPHEAIFDLLPYFSTKIQKHIALDNVSFEVYRGEFLGIIGQNGSGKSTLLKILCGVLHQTSGEIQINGKILSLLELGTGFNGDLTGRENLFVSASLMGFDTKLITDRLSEIEAFADIEEYFDAPVKTYSSGMYVRLAMAMFLHLEPEIFIIDEALSVGDIFFQQKCFAKIEEMRNRGVTFLFVSHDINTVLKMSDKVLLLYHSKQIYYGDKNRACRLYYDDKNDPKEILHDVKVSKHDEKSNVLIGKRKIFHDQGGDISSLHIIDEVGNHTFSVEMTNILKFIIGYTLDNSLVNPTIVINLYNNTRLLITSILHDLRNDKKSIEIHIPFFLEAGEYSFDLLLTSRVHNAGQTIVEYPDLGPVLVSFDYSKKQAPFFGLVGLNPYIIFEKNDGSKDA